MQQIQHVIFYDGNCPLCNRSIHFLLKADKHKIFYFAPLNGETAKKKLSDFQLEEPDLDTLVLLENFNTAKEQVFIEGRGALRIFWLLGGKYAWLGSLFFLPQFLANCTYRWVAKRRYRLFKKRDPLQNDNERFLK